MSKPLAGFAAAIKAQWERDYPAINAGVYGLIDGRYNTLYYVGSSTNIADRLMQHYYNAAYLASFIDVDRDSERLHHRDLWTGNIVSSRSIPKATLLWQFPLGEKWVRTNALKFGYPLTNIEAREHIDRNQSFTPFLAGRCQHCTEQAVLVTVNLSYLLGWRYLCKDCFDHLYDTKKDALYGAWQCEFAAREYRYTLARIRSKDAYATPFNAQLFLAHPTRQPERISA